MIIKGKTVFVYDVEVFPNLFTCCIKNSESGNIVNYEISSRNNEIESIYNIFHNKNIIFCGYNNLHYDDPIINYILMSYEVLHFDDYYNICRKIKELSDTIIETKDNNFSSWSKYKYAHLFPSFDLLAMMFSSKLRVGLKEMQVTMQYKNVQEYDGDFNSLVPQNDIDDVLEYNRNDVESTCELLSRLKEDIDLRLAIEKEYGINVLSKDGVNIGMEIIKSRYLKETELTWNEIKDKKSECTSLCLGDIIFDFIQFKTKTLQDLLKDLKNQTITPNDNSFERKFILGGVPHTFGMGGIHSVNEPEQFEPKDSQLLIDQDVTSMYPSIILQHKVYPPHLGEAFLTVYQKIKDDRVKAKHEGNKLVDKTLKLALNGLSGNLQSEHSWVYSPKTALTIRINGQLMLLMLAEALDQIGAQIIQSNTDGVFILLDKSKLNEMQNVVNWWEKTTKLTLEADYFERFYQFAINDYVGVKKGWSETHDPKLIKKKGLFIDSVTLGKGMAPTIVAEAINNYLVLGKEVDETLKECDDILKFCTYQKVSKDFLVEYNEHIIRRINRYYMSTDGGKMYKCKRDPLTLKLKNYISMCPSKVTLYNEFNEMPIKERHINYTYYRSEAYKIIDAIKSKQLMLF